MKVGDYVRNQYGIAKLINIEKNNDIDILVFDKNICFLVDKKTKEIQKNKLFNKLPLTREIDINKIKNSPNIIDLIEIGDYVNGYLVKNRRASCNENLCGHPKQIDIGENKECKWIAEKDIKSIVTKEQFENMEYKIND